MASVQLSQLQGLAEGFNSARPADPLTPLQFIDLHLSADSDDVMAEADPALRLGPSRMPLFDWLALEQRRSHCSSLVKITEEGELLHVHNPWWSRDSLCSVWSTAVPLSLLALRHSTGLRSKSAESAAKRTRKR